MLEHQLYHTVLILAGIANMSMALVLLHGNLAYGDYPVYRNARRFVALCFTLFAIGFFLHAHFNWRNSWHEAASALSVSYFHCGAVLFGWSQISLLNPNYLSRKIVVRDLLLLTVGLMAYWSVVLLPSVARVGESVFVIFFIHAIIVTYTFYRTYYRVRKRLQQLSHGTIEQFVRWMLLSCHLIIVFGIGSIVVTACLPNAVWPYTLLMAIGILVFVYIFFSINDYGYVIDSTTNATEDVAGYY